MTKTVADLYDFSDVSDLPEAVAARLTRERSEPSGVADVVEIVSEAPRALTLAQVLAVAARKGVELPVETTVRSYLNRAVDDGRLVKPTRQTYAGPTDAEDTGMTEQPEIDADELADLN